MAEIILYLSLIALVSMVIGLLVGRQSVKADVARRVQEAYNQARKELEAEKQELGATLNEQLLKIRESIIVSAEAYEAAVEAVEHRLGVPLPADSVLESPRTEQLHLEFKRDAERHSHVGHSTLQERAATAAERPAFEEKSTHGDSFVKEPAEEEIPPFASAAQEPSVPSDEADTEEREALVSDLSDQPAPASADAATSAEQELDERKSLANS